MGSKDTGLGSIFRVARVRYASSSMLEQRKSGDRYAVSLIAVMDKRHLTRQRHGCAVHMLSDSVTKLPRHVHAISSGSACGGQARTSANRTDHHVTISGLLVEQMRNHARRSNQLGRHNAFNHSLYWGQRCDRAADGFGCSPTGRPSTTSQVRRVVRGTRSISKVPDAFKPSVAGKARWSGSLSPNIPRTSAAAVTAPTHSYDEGRYGTINSQEVMDNMRQAMAYDLEKNHRRAAEEVTLPRVWVRIGRPNAVLYSFSQCLMFNTLDYSRFSAHLIYVYIGRTVSADWRERHRCVCVNNKAECSGRWFRGF
eukprot:6672748-Pyramimonas_sp.AAC.6